MWLDPGRHGGAAGVSLDDTVSLSELQAPDVMFDTSASFASPPAWLPLSTFACPSSPRLYFSLSLQVTGLGPCWARCLTEASQKASGCLSHRTLLIILTLIFILFVSPTCIFFKSVCVFSRTQNSFPITFLVTPSYSRLLFLCLHLHHSFSLLKFAFFAGVEWQTVKAYKDSCDVCLRGLLWSLKGFLAV